MAGRILVLDDEENYAEMLQDLLRDHNYWVDMATRPERAIARLEEIPYDLVISDYKMPVMDGSDFLRKARQLYPNLPFILVSGLMNTPELVKVANMRVTSVMEKPLDTEEFLTQVAKYTEAITPEERQAFADQVTSRGASGAYGVISYPEEPRFFSATSFDSKCFMQDFWSASQAQSHLFIAEPLGGDAALAVKDLSVWRGNVDKPIQELDFQDLKADGLDRIEALLSNQDVSDVISIRLSSMELISAAQSHLSKVLESIDSASNALFVYLVEHEKPVEVFSKVTGSVCLVLPALRQRPSDLAHYVRRSARMLAERSAKPKAAEFTPEAAYAILQFDWAGNYKQVQEVISYAVERSDDTPITLEVLDEVIRDVVVLAPQQRLGALLQNAQTDQLERDLVEIGGSIASLMHSLELSSNPKTLDDLRALPLVDPTLATL